MACRGAFALGLDVRPDEAAGWRTVSYETGPDDDVDAVFAQRDRSIEIEVFCNLGTPDGRRGRAQHVARIAPLPTTL